MDLSRILHMVELLQLLSVNTQQHHFLLLLKYGKLATGVRGL